jgi:hypothetical protein
MSNEVATNDALPPSVQNMAASLAASVAAVGGAGGGDLYMKMTKFGEFVYGADQTPVEEGSIWAANPLGFQHGYTCWGTKEHGTEGQNVGEVLVPAATPLPDVSTLPQAKGNWSKAIALQVRCTNGEDEGVQTLFKANSDGGRKAYAGLLQALVEQLGKKVPEVVPLIELENDWYEHASYGKIFKPVFKVVGWTTMDGEAAPAKIEEAANEEPAVAEKPAKEEAPRRRRRKA